MLFQDRFDAGNQLADRLTDYKNNSIVVSLLRGGIIVGAEIANKLKVGHFPLAVAKIPAPFQSELAIGALCFDFTYLESRLINSLALDKLTVRQQISLAKEKFNSYLKQFDLKKSNYRLKNKTVVLVDDGIATGSTVKAALLFIKSLRPKKIISAIPVAPIDFETAGFDETIILHREQNFSSVSQFYKSFPQVDDDEIKRLLY